MTDTELSQLLPTIVLYAVNIYAPATKETILEVTSTAKMFSEVKPKRLASSVQRAIEQLVREALVDETIGHQLYPTFRGIKALSTRRLGFPRDTNRLYYLKLLQQRRGK